MSYYSHTLKYILSVLMMFYAAQTTAATYTYNGGQLTGANGIEALGGTWNVTFHDGSFDYVDSIYGLSTPFRTYDESLALSEALGTDMSTVLGGVLDPEDVNGCSNFNIGCNIVTPHKFTTFTNDLFSDMRVTGFSVTVSPLNSIVGGAESITLRDTDFDNYSYAVWEASAVPIPSAVWLFGSGLIGLIGVARRKKA